MRALHGFADPMGHQRAGTVLRGAARLVFGLAARGCAAAQPLPRHAHLAFVRARREQLEGKHACEGHGHHRAVGILLPEAVGAAADPARWPGTSPWKVARLFVRSQRRDATIEVPIGDLDPFYGLSYAQIAHDALRKHRSQGRWGAGPGIGSQVRWYRLMGGGEVDGLVDGLPRLEAPPEAAEWAAAVARARKPAELAGLLRQAPTGPYAPKRSN